MPSERRPRDTGMVTAELAACLPVLVVVLAVALTAISVVAARVRLQDAAREAARAGARGDLAAAHRLAAEAAPGSTLQLDTSPAQVVASVRERIAPLGDWLPSWTVTARAVAAAEPRGGDP